MLPRARFGDRSLLSIAAVLASSLVAIVAMPSRAEAQEFPRPPDRNYGIDFFHGSAIGSGRIIGMGGTAVATAQGSSGMLYNAAAPANRPAVSSEGFDWDWHLDSSSLGLGSDFDNNGIESEERNLEPTATIGLVLQYGPWGIGVSSLATSSSRGVEDASMGSYELSTTAAVVNVGVARSFAQEQLVVGASMRALALNVERTAMDGGITGLLSHTGASVEVGAIYKPLGQRWRTGVDFKAPIQSDGAGDVSCDPNDCEGFVLPSRVHSPWQLGGGLAYRFGGSAWNQKIASAFRDEKATIVALDLIVSGRTERGAGIEAFTNQSLQPSGRTITTSLRGGVDYEWFPGRFRVRAGSYWEGSRFKDREGAAIPGRLHLTSGFDWRFWSFEFWDAPYRLRLSFTIDTAHKYVNSGLSIGFWH